MSKTPKIKLPENLALGPSQQQIAVFGAPESGKTSLLSTFYGLTQNTANQAKPYQLIADNPGEAARLQRNHDALQQHSDYPTATTVQNAKAHSFTVQLRDSALPPQKRGFFCKRKRRIANPATAKPFDALQLTWHDYPGEWLTSAASNDTESAKRATALRGMLGSQIAIMLFDAAKIEPQNPTATAAYLSETLSIYTTSLQAAKAQILVKGKRLLEFPRIWIFALSKADLLPELDAHGFRDLLQQHASAEIAELQQTITGFIKADKALAVGEDYLLLSSKNPRYGIETLLPLAAILPFERHEKWAQRLKLPGKLSGLLLKSASVAALALVSGKIKMLPAPLRWGLSLIGSAGVERGIKHLSNKLHDHSELSQQRAEILSLALQDFYTSIEDAEKDRIFLTSVH